MTLITETSDGVMTFVSRNVYRGGYQACASVTAKDDISFSAPRPLIRRPIMVRARIRFAVRAARAREWQKKVAVHGDRVSPLDIVILGRRSREDE